MNLTETVFSDSDSEWNKTRERLESAVLLAAAELTAHTGAAAFSMDGHGVSVSVKTIVLSA